MFSASTAQVAAITGDTPVRNVIYIIGLIVVVIVVLKVLGLY